MGVWAQKPQFTNQIQWIFSISIIFGHRQSFLKNCSPWPVPFWAQQRFLQEKFQLSLERKENISSKHAACAQSRSIAIEPLYLYFIFLLLCPNAENPWGTFPKNLFLCPNPHAGVAGITIKKTHTRGGFTVNIFSPGPSSLSNIKGCHVCNCCLNLIKKTD